MAANFSVGALQRKGLSGSTNTRPYGFHPFMYPVVPRSFLETEKKRCEMPGANVWSLVCTLDLNLRMLNERPRAISIAGLGGQLRDFTACLEDRCATNRSHTVHNTSLKLRSLHLDQHSGTLSFKYVSHAWQPQHNNRAEVSLEEAKWMFRCSRRRDFYQQTWRKYPIQLIYDA